MVDVTMTGEIRMRTMIVAKDNDLMDQQNTSLRKEEEPMRPHAR